MKYVIGALLIIGLFGFSGLDAQSDWPKPPPLPPIPKPPVPKPPVPNPPDRPSSPSPSSPSKPAKPGSPSPAQPPSSGDTTPSDSRDTGTPKDADALALNWQAEQIIPAVKSAAKDKKVIFIYFYFNKEKEDFPPNYDKKLVKESEEKYIFAKVLVSTYKNTKTGKILISDDNAEFFVKHKIPLSPIGVALDPYGNLMDKLAPPMSAPKIIPFLNSAEKKYLSLENDFNTRYNNGEKLLNEIESATGDEKERKRTKNTPETIKLLQGITKTEYEGYPAIKKSETKLKELNKRATKEYSEMVKNYTFLDEELRNPKTITPELE
ncbi:MAG: hypothetical protein QME51_11815, partial [Planctomycetota bacterium]|nr:hypothetical protein [Planctomycetota bacterium]